ncbi:MAG: exodeoxyribonuclease VII large subunit [SAR324 cluster bacterium]|nr:exodeoxyribonuclease VII large subunit [SAR324 cluster bacterium]
MSFHYRAPLKKLTAEEDISPKVWQVKEISAKIKSVLENKFSVVYVTGEVSNYFNHHLSGHRYFSLKDDQATIKCVLFKNQTNFDFTLKDGLAVIVLGKISTYPQQGVYQIIIDHIIPRDRGVLDLEFEKLKHKLTKLGFFAEINKKSVPTFVQRLGIVTAQQSDALKDIIKVSSDRFPKIHYFVMQTKVTGKRSAQSIASAIKRLDAYSQKTTPLDVIIVSRGGGSKEDLWGFNEEVVVKAISKCKTPLITAIGHQADLSLADLAADHMAKTPSDAAVYVTHKTLDDINELIENSAIIFKEYITNHAQSVNYRLTNINNALGAHCNKLILTAKIRLNKLQANLDKDYFYVVTGFKQKLASASGSLKNFDVHDLFKKKCGLLTNLSADIRQLMKHKIYEHKKNISYRQTSLEDNNPTNILKKGYAVIFKKRNLITKSTQVTEGDKVTIKWHDNDKIAKIEPSD